VAALLLATVLFGCKGNPPEPPPPASARVSTVTVEPEEVTAYVRAVGTVEAVDEAVLSTKLMGRVEDISVDAGDMVKKGQTLATIDASDVRARKAEAQSAVAEGEAALVEAKAALENAETNLGRMQALHDDEAVTKKELDDTRTQCDMMRAKVSQVEAKISQARSAIKQAESALAYSVIKSPVDGFVVAKMMNAGDTAAPGMPLLKVSDTKNLRVSAIVKEGDLPHVTEGIACTVRIDALEKDLDGKVAEVVPVADPATRSSEVKVSVPVTEGLRPGMFARANIPSGTRMALTVPVSAIVKQESVDGVYIVIDGVVAFQPVRTGDIKDGRIEVVSGLEGGESLVVSDTSGLKEGMKAVAE